MFKLVAIDCDGTLLNEKNEMTKATIESIMLLKQQGIKIVLASARPFYRLKKYLEILKLLDSSQYTIAFNGGVIINNKTQEEVFSKAFDSNELRLLLDLAKVINPNVFLYSKDEIFSNHYNDAYVKRNPDVNFNVVNFDQIDLMEKIIYKFVFVNSPENIAKLKSIFPNDIKEKFEVTNSVPQFIEVVKKNVTKSFALEKIGHICNINREEMVAFGDQDNDIPMMEFAGYSVAMGNSSDTVKRFADFVTKSNAEDGVAYAIKHIFAEN